jgi:hypothetical protein
VWRGPGVLPFSFWRVRPYAPRFNPATRALDLKVAFLGLLDWVFLIALVPVIVLWVLARSKGRLWSGAWLLTIAPLLVPMGEDGSDVMFVNSIIPDFVLDSHPSPATTNPSALNRLLATTSPRSGETRLSSSASLSSARLPAPA